MIFRAFLFPHSRLGSQGCSLSRSPAALLPTNPRSDAPALKAAPPAGRRVTSRKKLQPVITIADNPSEVFVVRWSPDSKYLAAGSGDGSIKVFNADTGRVSFDLQPGSAAALPATSLRFRPSNDATRTKNVLVSTNAVGAVQHWHVTSGKCLHTIEEADNQVYALDYRPDGLEFATGGKDATVRLYDESTGLTSHRPSLVDNIRAKWPMRIPSAPSP
jgi:WD40 repeat protein